MSDSNVSDEFIKTQMQLKIFQLVCMETVVLLENGKDTECNGYPWFHLVGFITICNLQFPEIEKSQVLDATNVGNLNAVIDNTINLITNILDQEKPPLALMNLLPILYFELDEYEKSKANGVLFEKRTFDIE